MNITVESLVWCQVWHFQHLDKIRVTPIPVWIVMLFVTEITVAWPSINVWIDAFNAKTADSFQDLISQGKAAITFIECDSHFGSILRFAVHSLVPRTIQGTCTKLIVSGNYRLKHTSLRRMHIDNPLCHSGYSNHDSLVYVHPSCQGNKYLRIDFRRIVWILRIHAGHARRYHNSTAL